ncbi:MAG TPA: CHAP domain-containing protein [Clostridia bacterium]|nr:CHAP domain-containing protein [Clostridia bacterium]
MVSPTNQARKTNDFFFQLQSFSEAAHAFLKDPQEQQWGDWSRKTLLIALKNTLLSLGLLNIDQLPPEESELRFFCEVLDNFLSQSTNETLASTVPTEKLEKLKKDLEQQNLENKEYLAKVQEENEKQFAHLRRIAEIKKELVAALEKQNQAIAEPQAETLASEINENLELEPLKETLKRAATAETGSPLKESAWQEINQEYQEAIEQIPNLSPQVKEYLLNHPLSLKTAQELATSSQTQEKQAILKKAISPLTEAQKQAVEDLAMATAVNLVSLDPKASTREIRDIIGFSLGQELSQLASQQLSPEKVSALAQILQKESSRLIDGNSPPLPGLTPEIVTSKQRLFVSVTTPALPGTQAGSIPQILIEGELTPAQKTFETIKSGSFGQKSLDLISEEIGVAQSYHFARQGLNISAIYQISQREQIKNPQSQRKESQFKGLQINYQQFEQKFAFIAKKLKYWALNRVRFFQTLRRIPSPMQVFFQKALSWFYKTGLGKGFKSFSARLAQRGLQTLLNSAIGKGIKLFSIQGLKKIVGSLTLTSFHAAAATVSLGTSLAITAAITLAKKTFKESLSLAGKFMETFTLGALKKEDLKFIPIAVIGTLIFLSSFSYYTIVENIGGALVGTGKGASIPGITEPLGSSLDCDKVEKNSAEELVCDIRSCIKSGKVSLDNWLNHLSCIENLWQNKETVRNILYNHIICKGCNNLLQCVGFVLAYEETRNHSMVSRNACEYVTNHQGFEAIKPYYKDGVLKCPAKEGDIAVWGDPACGQPPNHYGHVAIVVREDGSVISVAEADGLTGIVDVIKYPCGREGGPTVFLRKE